MASIQDLLNAVGAYHRNVQKALSAKRDRMIWVNTSQQSAAEIRGLLDDSMLRQELNELLVVLQNQLDDRDTAHLASGILAKHLAEFVKAEANLHSLTHVRTKLYLDVVREVQPWISSNNSPRFPKTSEEFRSEFERIHEEFLTTISTAPALPRKESKQVKGEFLWQFWRYSLGTLITVGNVYMTYHQPSFQGMGGTSVTVGAWYFFKGTGNNKKPPKSQSGGDLHQKTGSQ